MINALLLKFQQKKINKNKHKTHEMNENSIGSNAEETFFLATTFSMQLKGSSHSRPNALFFHAVGILW